MIWVVDLWIISYILNVIGKNKYVLYFLWFIVIVNKILSMTYYSVSLSMDMDVLGVEKASMNWFFFRLLLLYIIPFKYFFKIYCTVRLIKKNTKIINCSIHEHFTPIYTVLRLYIKVILYSSSLHYGYTKIIKYYSKCFLKNNVVEIDLLIIITIIIPMPDDHANYLYSN